MRINEKENYIIYSCGSIGFKKNNNYYISRHSVCSIIAIFDEVEKLGLNITPIMLYNTIKFSSEIRDGDLLDTEHIEQIAEYLKIRIIIHDYNNGNLAKFTSRSFSEGSKNIVLFNYNKHYMNKYDMDYQKSIQKMNFISILDLMANTQNYSNYYFIRSKITNYISDIRKNSMLLDPYESSSSPLSSSSSSSQSSTLLSKLIYEDLNLNKNDLFGEIKSDINDFENYKVYNDGSMTIDNNFIVYDKYITNICHTNIINLFNEFKTLLFNYNITSPLSLLLYLQNFIVSINNRDEVCSCIADLLNIKVIDLKTNCEYTALNTINSMLKEFYFI